MKEKNKKVLNNSLRPILVKTGLKKWFTLVELIIVITTLAILATIAFVSFGNYNKSSRDANRVATLKSIEKWLSLVEVKNWKYPTPDEYITISSWTTIYINQWIVWQTVSQNILLNKESKDPKDNTNYQYSTNWNNTKYQLWTYLEEDNKMLLSLTPLLLASPLVKGEQNFHFPLISGIEGVFIPQTYASSIDYINRYFYTIWDIIWILTKTTNAPITNTDYLTWLDLETNTDSFKIYFSNDVSSWSIIWSWSDLVDKIIENQGNNWTQKEIPAPAQVPPVMWNVPNQTYTSWSAITNLNMSSYVTQTDWDVITNYALTWTLPAGLTFNLATWILSGTPTQTGTFNLSVTATDNDWISSSKSFTITVMAIWGIFTNNWSGNTIYVWELNWQKYMTTPGKCTNSPTPTCAWPTDTLYKDWKNSDTFTANTNSTTDWLANTNAMTSDPTEALKHPAAKYCADMVYWWYDDWFLPAKDELNLLYTNRDAIWGFSTYSTYWSSTQQSDTSVWSKAFYNVSQGYAYKFNTYLLRCIHKF